MKRMSVAGLACRDLMMRIFVVFALSVSVLSAIADPLAQLAVASDVDDASKIAFAFTPDLDPEEATLPEITTKIPDLRFDDLRAERQASSHEWRVSCAFEARGPPSEAKRSVRPIWRATGDRPWAGSGAERPQGSVSQIIAETLGSTVGGQGVRGPNSRRATEPRFSPL